MIEFETLSNQELDNENIIAVTRLEHSLLDIEHVHRIDRSVHSKVHPLEHDLIELRLLTLARLS